MESNCQNTSSSRKTCRIRWKDARGLVAVVGIVLLTTGCVVQQTRSGQIQFGIDADALLGTKVGTFNSVQGPVTIRRNTDGTYGMRIESRFQVLRLGRYDRLDVVSVSEGAQNTAVVLRTASGTGACPNYRLVNISRDRVGEVRLQSGCNEIDFQETGGKLAMRQRVDTRARWWHWEDGRFNTSMERTAPRQATHPPARQAVVGTQPPSSGREPRDTDRRREPWTPPNQNPGTTSGAAPRLPPPPPNAERTSVEIVRVNLVDEKRQ